MDSCSHLAWKCILMHLDGQHLWSNFTSPLIFSIILYFNCISLCLSFWKMERWLPLNGAEDIHNIFSVKLQKRNFVAERGLALISWFGSSVVAWYNYTKMLNLLTCNMLILHSVGDITLLHQNEWLCPQCISGCVLFFLLCFQAVHLDLWCCVLMPSVNKDIKILIAICAPHLKHSLSTAVLHFFLLIVFNSSMTYFNVTVEQSFKLLDLEWILFF